MHDEATGEALLDEALALLRAGGPEAVTVRAVAEAAGTSARAVYSVFGSIQGMLDALAQRGYARLVDLVAAVPETDDPAGDLVTVGMQGFRTFALEEPVLFRLTFEQVSAELLENEAVAQTAYDTYRALRSRVRRLRAAGGVHPDRTDVACCFAFHATCQGLCSSEMSTWQPPDGPGFWGMLHGADLAPVWHDTLTGLVARFRHPPGEADQPGQTQSATSGASTP
ncbi:transcriptional regulator, TetR family [Pseudonocardia thermophila]|uniref:Transcriptional regulator, TetR family n=1 Tax=Pseudonocardia thermophila TaxID=1848 RepID=A0A1M6UZ95_PSETH|nr:transcriptional regulator, TetR family [Pseudonocardia thermophila]